MRAKAVVTMLAAALLGVLASCGAYSALSPSATTPQDDIYSYGSN